MEDETESSTDSKPEDLEAQVDKLIEDQQKEKEDAARTEALEKHLKEIEKAKAELERVISEQEELRDQANQSGLRHPDTLPVGLHLAIPAFTGRVGQLSDSDPPAPYQCPDCAA